MTTGEASAGLALVLRLMAMSGWVMQTVRGIFENVGVIQESMQTIARPHAITDRPDAATLAVSGGDIRFENVSFHYGRDDAAIIEDLSLRIRPGEKVGLVGVSGAGKTTITALLLRLHDLESGRILVDGQDIAGVTQGSLRSAIAMVTQDTSLLHRSIRDNIAYGRPDAPRPRWSAPPASPRPTPSSAPHRSQGPHRLRRPGGRARRKASGRASAATFAIARVILKDARSSSSTRRPPPSTAKSRRRSRKASSR